MRARWSWSMKSELMHLYYSNERAGLTMIDPILKPEVLNPVLAMLCDKEYAPACPATQPQSLYA